MCNKVDIIYNGKEKLVYSTDDAGQVIIHFNDFLTAYRGIKRAEIADKGKYCNKISSMLFKVLNDNGIPTHFIQRISDSEQLCSRIQIVPLQIIVRNRLAGSTAEMLGLADGLQIDNVVTELRYNNDEVGDPMINQHHAVALGIASYEEMNYILDLSARVNALLRETFLKAGIELVDFKMEVGRDSDGKFIVSDEISPDTCRLWDIQTGEKLDKDRFRHDLSDVKASYREVMERLEKIIG